MVVKLAVLFFAPLLAGLAAYLVRTSREIHYKMLLIFAGAYLFSITVIHILPELYRQSDQLEWVGVFVLAGFLLQHVLEYFTAGVEHGHLHHHNHQGAPRTASALMLLVALCVHAFLEGGILAQPASFGFLYDVNTVLLGIALHRIPAAFALVTVLIAQLQSRRKVFPYLLVFSMAAPIGLLLSTYFVESHLLSVTGLYYLYALVSGNFLHISSTIVAESSPGHKFHPGKLLAAMLGALLAVLMEYAM